VLVAGVTVDVAEGLGVAVAADVFDAVAVTVWVGTAVVGSVGVFVHCVACVSMMESAVDRAESVWVMAASEVKRL
jgi:hypothetical protein